MEALFNTGGYLWLVINVGLVVVLGLALAYAVMAWRRRPARAETEGERKTREIYSEPRPDRK